MGIAQRTAGYEAVIEFILDGIPCLIGVSYFKSVKPWRGSAHACPSSDDYYGYTEVEYELLDRRGYRAGWLDAKVMPLVAEAIRAAIINHFSEE